jgi:hypothetical protein
LRHHINRRDERNRKDYARVTAFRRLGYHGRAIYDKSLAGDIIRTEFFGQQAREAIAVGTITITGSGYIGVVETRTVDAVGVIALSGVGSATVGSVATAIGAVSVTGAATSAARATFVESDRGTATTRGNTAAMPPRANVRIETRPRALKSRKRNAA